MEMVAGNNLVYDWMSFNESQKESLIQQLAEQLQLWHSISCDSYSMPIVSYTSFNNLKPAVERLTEKEIKLIQKDKLPKEIADKVDMLVQFYHDNINILDETDTAVMVHQDIHLENIFHKDGQLTGIIDLDWACQAPKDYELWKIMDTFHRPKFTVEEKIEHLYGDYQMTKELSWLKKYYPALFQIPNLANRVRLYYLDPFLETLIDYQNGLWKGRGLLKAADKITDFYQNNWLDEALKI
jgi:aminoglycoside phosphotransferase (APT) family kinase protein